MGTLIVVSLVAYTAVALLFKAAAQHTRPDGLVGVALAVVTCATAAMMAARGEWGGSWAGAGIALLSGGLFSLGSICRVKALATTPVSLVFAITNLDLVLAGAVALFLPIFGQTLTVWNVLAIVVAGVAIMLGAQIRGGERIAPVTFLALGILTTSSLGFVSYARFFPTSLLFFILLNHLAGVLLNARALRTARPAELKWGLALGCCMFVGFWTLLQALAVSGDSISLVLLALSMKTPFIALLAVPLFKERMTAAKVVAIGMASLAVMLWEGGPALGHALGALPGSGWAAIPVLAAVAALAAAAGYRPLRERPPWLRRSALATALRARLLVEVIRDDHTGALRLIRVAARGQPMPVLMRLHSGSGEQQVYAPEQALATPEPVTAVTLTLPTVSAHEVSVRVPHSPPGAPRAYPPLALELRGWTNSYCFDLPDTAGEIVVPIDRTGNWCWLLISPRDPARADGRARAVGETYERREEA